MWRSLGLLIWSSLSEKYIIQCRLGVHLVSNLLNYFTVQLDFVQSPFYTLFCFVLCTEIEGSRLPCMVRRCSIRTLDSKLTLNGQGQLIITKVLV